MLRTSSQATLSSFETVWIGAQKGLDECSKQFMYERWPCPESILSEVYQNHLPINREVAFVQAIISAGIVHTVTRNCSAGSLDNCKCTRSSILNGNDDEQSMRNDFRWGGCSDNVELGYRVAVAHLDDRETGQDLKAKIRLHNHRVGRISVKETMIRKCKCHGVSGSCSMQTCWMKVNEFREIGNYLKKAYRKAVKIENNSPWEQNNQPEVPTWKLMYLHDSPDYCKADMNSTFGSYTGTLGRHCSMRKDDDVTGEERKSCRRLCKQCGYRVRRERRIITTTCNCRFEFCCQVHCQQCQREEFTYVCAPSLLPSSSSSSSSSSTTTTTTATSV
ncbi:Ligand for members of the frizzled of seven transmembrane receptors [Dermatophagoides farinae]|uniref:Protein Wnt n=1 Tax=Dermatophagoides farinae TaxID=6954 RepID=A0A922HQD6_DERFA|nr:Ligand for members of the frizzled of seven transmembrane receptors [Dermatophagoides farinae]